MGIGRAQNTPPPENETFSAEEANAAAKALQNEPRFALIIGVPDYKDPGVPDLPVCEADAEAVYELLTNPEIGGVPKRNATLLTGEAASRRSILKALNGLKAAPKEATVFFYFSGHGARQGTQTYLIPQDAEADFLAGSALSQDELNRYLSAVPASRVALFVDACFAAGLRTTPGVQTKAFATDAEEALKSFTGRGRIFFGAAGADEEALTAPDKQRSVFTLHLLDGLGGQGDANRDGVVTAYELSSYLDRTVSAEAAKRGGLHRPRVDIPADVTNPSRYPLTINAPALKARTDQAAKTAKRLEVLDGFFLDGALTRPQRDRAAQLLKRQPSELSRTEKQARDAALAVTDSGTMNDRLARALDLLQERAPVPPSSSSGAGAAKSLMRLRPETPEPLQLGWHSVSVLSLAISPDGKRALSGAVNGNVGQWDLEPRLLVGPLDGHTGRIHSIAFSPDGESAATASGDRLVRLWNLEKAAEIRRLEGHAWGVHAVAFSPDGKKAASGDWKGIVKLWDVETGEVTGTLDGHKKQVNALVFLADGRKLLSASGEKRLILWNLEGGDATVLPAAHRAAVRALAVTPDGERAVSASEDGLLIVWDLQKGVASKTLTGHLDEVTAVAITPDGRWAISGSADKTVRIWNLETGRQERVLTGHEGQVNAVAAMPDGRRILSGSNDRTLQIWEVFEPER
ncbi:MAG: caspase family protein [Planctomycetota bacterium]